MVTKPRQATHLKQEILEALLNKDKNQKDQQITKETVLHAALCQRRVHDMFLTRQIQ